MTTQEKIKVYCYAQHCSSRNGGIVPVSEIEAWEGENPEKVEAGDYCDDWNLIAEGTEEEVVGAVRANLKVTNRVKPTNSNIMFYRRQLRNVLERLGRPETPARMIDRDVFASTNQIKFTGDEFEREEIDSEQPEFFANLTGWEPFTEVWRCGDDGEEWTYYAVAK